MYVSCPVCFLLADGFMRCVPSARSQRGEPRFPPCGNPSSFSLCRSCLRLTKESMDICFGKWMRRFVWNHCFRITCSFLYILPGTYEATLSIKTSLTPKQGFKEGNFKKGQPQRGRSPICGSPFCPVPKARTAETVGSEKTNQTRNTA